MSLISAEEFDSDFPLQKICRLCGTRRLLVKKVADKVLVVALGGSPSNSRRHRYDVSSSIFGSGTVYLGFPV